jgi:hypothetical protein
MTSFGKCPVFIACRAGRAVKRGIPISTAHVALHIQLSARLAGEVFEPAFPVDVPGPHVSCLDRKVDAVETQFLGQSDAGAHQLRADADVLELRADRDQHLTFPPVDGEEDGVADDAFRIATGDNVQAGAEHLADPVYAHRILDRRQALKTVPRLESEVHVDEPLSGRGGQKADVQPQPGLAGEGAGQAAGRDV